MNIRSVSAAVLLTVCVLTGCRNGSDPLLKISSQTYNPDDGILLEPAVTVETPAEVDGTEDVYWVKGGKVWHKSRECSALLRSTDIISGTLNEALSSGKDRGCQRCQN